MEVEKIVVPVQTTIVTDMNRCSVTVPIGQVVDLIQRHVEKLIKRKLPENVEIKTDPIKVVWHEPLEGKQ